MSIHNSRSSFSRREFLQTTASASALSLLPTVPSVPGTCGPELPEAFSSLKPLGSHVKPIAVEEFRGRLQHAQKLMTEQKPRLDALFLAPGTSLGYNADPTKPGQLVIALNGGNGRNVNYIIDGGDNMGDTRVWRVRRTDEAAESRAW